MADVKLDARAFHRRARRLLGALDAGGPDFAGAEALCFLASAGDDVPVYSKSSAVQTWLLGYEFPDTITVIVRGKLIFLTTIKKGAYLDSLRQDDGVNFEVVKRPKDDSQDHALFGKLFSAISSTSSKKLGVIAKDDAKGKIVDLWKNYLKTAQPAMEQVDVSMALAVLFAIKDEDEIRTIRHACKISSAAMRNYLVPQMTTCIDEGKKITHEQLTTQVEDALLDENKSKKLELPSDVVHSLIDWCYPPIIQSGGKYDLRPSASSNPENLHEGIIVCSLGARYKSYCSNVGRTYLMNPSKSQEANYKFLLDLQAHLLAAIRNNVLTSDVYAKALEYIESKRPELKASFTKNCGFVIGIEFRESNYVLGPKTPRELKTGMVINLSIGFQGIENPKGKDSRSKTYALYLADTVQITTDEAVVLTEAEKDIGSISYTFGDDDDDIKENIVESLPKRRGAVMDSKLRDDSDRVTTAQKRKGHQKQLRQQRHEEGLSRFSEGGSGNQMIQKTVLKKFQSYTSEKQMPRNVSDLRIIVDRRNESIILPVFGQAVPFHISTIKNVSKSDEQDFVLLRFNFVTPGQAGPKKEGPVPYDNPNATFVRALSYRSTEVNRFSEIFREVNDLKKEMMKRDAERMEMADLVEQASLIEVKGRRPYRLPDVHVRPGLEGKRYIGELEIHINGIRYQSQLKSDQRIDILFTNIKHFFFQPCEGELIVLLHVHLKNPIMIGKRKTRDVQFYREVSDANFDETGNRRRRANYGDEDELAQEQEERRRRQQLNREFQQFAERIKESSKSQFDVDVPFRDLGFIGVPYRQLVLLQPTTECLVHLSDLPVLVITVSEVEIAHLERVQFGLKNFDLVFVFKDFKRPVVHINTIPMDQLENVKEWLDSVDVPFTEGPVNLSWPQIMKTVNEDPKSFFEEAGGWSFLQLDSDDEGRRGDGSSSDAEESASEFEMSGSNASESESESDLSDQDSGSGYSGSDGSASGSGDDGEDESGEDWDELERKAARQDRKRGDRDDGRGGGSDSDDGGRRPSKKSKPSGRR